MAKNKNEFFYYLILSIIATIGLVLTIYGIIFDIFFNSNQIYVLLLKYFGFIIFSIAIISIVSILLINDKKNNKNQVSDSKLKEYLNNLDEIITDDKKDNQNE